MDDMKKCSACGGDMKMVCTEDHEHGNTCKMVCSACGHEEASGSEMPAEEKAPDQTM